MNDWVVLRIKQIDWLIMRDVIWYVPVFIYNMIFRNDRHVILNCTFCRKWILLNKASKNIWWIWQSSCLPINCSVFKCAFNRSMFYVLLCFFKGLDPDNLKRAARIKKNDNNSLIFDNFQIILINFPKKRGALFEPSALDPPMINFSTDADI